jgi:hypothetical protein
MNYLTNYYKNLCEQLQEKLNILEAQYNKATKTQRDVPYPGYDYEGHQQSKGWEIQDISPEAMDKVSQRYTKEIEMSDTSMSGVPSKYVSGREVMPRAKYDLSKFPSQPAQYSKKEDAPDLLDTITGVQRMKNQAINLANQRALADAQIRTMKGNSDILPTAIAKGENLDPSQGIDVEGNIMRRAKEAEQEVRTKKGKPFK